MVREADRHLQQVAPPGGTHLRHGRLDEVSGDVVLVAVRQVAVALLVLPDLDDGVDVAVLRLGPADHLGHRQLVREQLLVAGTCVLPGRGLEPLVDVGVGEDPPFRLALRESPGDVEVAEVSRLVQPVEATGDRGEPVGLTAFVPQTGGDPDLAERQRVQTGLCPGRRRGRSTHGAGRWLGAHPSPPREFREKFRNTISHTLDLPSKGRQGHLGDRPPLVAARTPRGHLDRGRMRSGRSTHLRQEPFLPVHTVISGQEAMDSTGPGRRRLGTSPRLATLGQGIGAA